MELDAANCSDVHASQCELKVYSAVNTPMRPFVVTRQRELRLITIWLSFQQLARPLLQC